MSARDTLAKAIYDNDCLIAAKIADDGMPLVSWEQFKQDNPESAAVTETFAGVYLSAISAAGYAVVPREATETMKDAGSEWVRGPNPAYCAYAAGNVWIAMLSAATTPEAE